MSPHSHVELPSTPMVCGLCLSGTFVHCPQYLTSCPHVLPPAICIAHMPLRLHALSSPF